MLGARFSHSLSSPINEACYQEFVTELYIWLWGPTRLLSVRSKGPMAPFPIQGLPTPHYLAQFQDSLLSKEKSVTCMTAEGRY